MEVEASCIHRPGREARLSGCCGQGAAPRFRLILITQTHSMEGPLGVSDTRNKKGKDHPTENYFLLEQHHNDRHCPCASNPSVLRGITTRGGHTYMVLVTKQHISGAHCDYNNIRKFDIYSV